jgi:hypothetical protein
MLRPRRRRFFAPRGRPTLERFDGSAFARTSSDAAQVDADRLTGPTPAPSPLYPGERVGVRGRSERHLGFPNLFAGTALQSDPRSRMLRRWNQRRPRPAVRLGLSTIELLVVITIAAALMAILFAVFGKVRELVRSWS